MSPEQVFNRRFGLRLRMVRTVLGLSEQQMADVFGRTLRTYRQYEAGSKPKGIGLAIKKLATKHHVNLNWLLMHGDDYLPGGRSKTRAAS